MDTLIRQTVGVATMHIGPHQIDNPVWLAPMAGVTDRPIRVLCRSLGAGMAISEMVHSDISLWDRPKSDRRLDIGNEPGPISVQIAGCDPVMMAAQHSPFAQLLHQWKHDNPGSLMPDG